MKFSEHWLREWVNPDLDTAALCHQLTMAGLEVDSAEPAAPAFNSVVVGKVLSVAPHPDADRLTICSVDVGSNDPLQIVCGARNVREGIRVPTALVGAQLPNGTAIRKGKLRGVESFGMLCSAVEIGVAESSEGLMILPDDAPLGTNIRSYFTLDDRCIEVGLTPNRSDCLSLRGIAREVGVLNKMEVTAPAIDAVADANNARFAVALEVPQACPRYAGRVVLDVDTSAPTPLWMRERLRRSGIRSINPVVDITNYVMLELGQPMHAFDLSRLEGGIEVRHSRAGERITLLDGKTLNLDQGTLLIADHQKPLALAGVMGGEGSGVTDDTRDIFLESAFFAPEAVSGKARHYGLHTDSSHRFERGVDPALQVMAIERATKLLLEITGGEPGPVVELCSEEHLPRRAPIRLRRNRITRILGLKVEPSQVQEILIRLGMQVVTDDEGWRVTPPGFRFDISIEVDLIEEIGRIYGYDNLPVNRPQASLEMPPVSESSVGIPRLRQVLVDRGYQEAITYSFIDPEMEKMFSPDNHPIALANPISAEMSVMRGSLWGGLAQALTYNLNRQQDQARFFEIGRRFIRHDDRIAQEDVVAGLVCGTRVPEQWGEPRQALDFYDIKSDVAALLAAGDSREIIYVPDRQPALHPGQAARIVRGGQTLGWLGALHPSLAQKLDLTTGVYLFELDLSALRQAKLPRFQGISKFPAIRRDIAIVIDEQISFQTVQECILKAAPKTLRSLRLFDMYRGKGIDSGKKSLAMAINLQDDAKTLTDEEIDAAIRRIVGALSDDLNAKLRD